MAKQLAEIKALFNKRFGYRETNWQKEKVQALGGLELDGLYLDGISRIFLIELKDKTLFDWISNVKTLVSERAGLKFVIFFKKERIHTYEVRQDRWWMFYAWRLTEEITEAIGVSKLFNKFKEAKGGQLSLIQRHSSWLGALERHTVEYNKKNKFGDQCYFKIWKDKHNNYPDDLILTFWNGERPSTEKGLPFFYFKIASSGSVEFFLGYNQSKDQEKKLVQRIISKIGGVSQYTVRGQLVYEGRRLYKRFDQIKDIGELFKEFIETDRIIIDHQLALFLAKNRNGKRLNGLAKMSFLEKNSSIDDNEIKEEQKTVDSTYVNLKVSSVRLNNIGLFKDVEINFDSRVTCLIGENGSGKSTILRALALGLIGVDQNYKVYSQPPKVIDFLRIEDYNGTEQRSPTGSIEVRCKEYNSDNEEIPQVLHINQLLIDKDKGAIEQIVNVDSLAPEEVDSKTEVENFSIVTDNMGVLKVPILGFTQGRTNKLAHGYEEEERSSSKANANDLVNLVFDTPDNRLSSLRNWLIAISSQIEEREVNAPSLKSVNIKVDDLVAIRKKTFEVIANIMGLESISYEGHKHIPHKELWINFEQLNENDEIEKVKINFKRLSQGFKSIFGWVGLIIKQLAEHYNYKATFYEEPAIVLVDEVDLFLHPKWQGSILNTLVQAFPKAQFIVTTHSPLVLSNVNPSEKIGVYLIGKGRSLALRSDIQGVVIQDAFMFMGVKQYPIMTQKIIDAFRLALASGDKENAVSILNELKKRLSSIDPYLISAEIELNFI